jgi:hydroxymethylpyrimidine pyrophosphatase-like HAD family hydrolase
MLIIAIDFDGTIVDNKYPEVGKLKSHAKEVINFLHEKGHKIIIWTCRGRSLEQDAVDFLDLNGIYYDYCNNNLPESIQYWKFESRKISYDVLIDDRNLNGFIGWDNVLDCLKKQFPEQIENFKRDENSLLPSGKNVNLRSFKCRDGYKIF